MTKRINFVDNETYRRMRPTAPELEPAHSRRRLQKIFINRDRWNTYSKPFKRDILNHELFHNKVPILGRSETLAIIYGKLKAKRGLGAALKVALQDGFGRKSRILHYLRKGI
jgi:hypothetical protein